MLRIATASFFTPGVSLIAETSQYGVRAISVVAETAPAGTINAEVAPFISPSPLSVITVSSSGFTVTGTPSLLMVTFNAIRLLLVAFLAISTDASETVLYPFLAKLTV